MCFYFQNIKYCNVVNYVYVLVLMLISIHVLILWLNVSRKKFLSDIFDSVILLNMLIISSSSDPNIQGKLCQNFIQIYNL